MWNDPIVEEVRKVRATHLERFGHDLDAIVRDLMEREKQGGRTFVELPPKEETMTTKGGMTPVPVGGPSVLGPITRE